MPPAEVQVDLEHRAVLGDDLARGRLDDAADLAGEHLGRTPALQVGERDVVNAGQCLVGALEPQIDVQEREPDRSLP